MSECVRKRVCLYVHMCVCVWSHVESEATLEYPKSNIKLKKVYSIKLSSHS